MVAPLGRGETGTGAMTWLERVFLRLMRRRRLAADLEAEMAFHREMAARNGNHIPFGNQSVVKEEALDLWRFTFVENLWLDTRFALRRLRANSGYSATAVISLALGIGISTAVFAVLNVVAFRPLPYPDEKSLVWGTEILKANSTDPITLTPDFLDWRRMNHTFDSLGAYRGFTGVVTGLREPLEIHIASASASLLSALRVAPAYGRLFGREEDRAGAPHVALVSHAFWREHLGSSNKALGKPVLIDGSAYSIVGVLPAGFVFPGDQPFDIITPLATNEAGELARDERFITTLSNVIGRLKPGVTIEQAHADLSRIQAHLPVPPFHPTITIELIPLRTFLFGDQKTTAAVLVTGALLFLLLASANLGNLALSQIVQRDRELAIRRALGAARGRVIAQLLIENALLVGVAGLLGICIAAAIRNAMSAMPQYGPRFYANLPLDRTVLLFAAGLLCGVLLVFGLIPALRIGETRLQTAIAAGQNSVAGRRSQLRYVSFVTAAQIAVVVALGSSAALTLQSFWNMRYRALGFQPEHTIDASLSLTSARYKDPGGQIAFIRELLARASAIPGVQQAAASIEWEVPPGRGHAMNVAHIEGRPLPMTSRQKAIMRNQDVSCAYFRILHIPLVEGRFLSDSDERNSTPVVVVSHEFAKRYFPGESAIGHRLQAGERENVWYTIVGVVGDVRSGGLESVAEPMVYTPYAQSESGRLWDLAIILDSSLPIKSVAPEFRTIVASIDPEEPVSRIETIDARLDQSAAQPRFTARLLTILSLLGAALAMAGVYGLTACRAKAQMREIAVRQALGAPLCSILSSMLKNAALVAGTGLLCGVALALASRQLISAMLFQVDLRNPRPILAVCVCIVLAVLAACIGPAWKASHASPIVILRES